MLRLLALLLTIALVGSAAPGRVLAAAGRADDGSRPIRIVTFGTSLTAGGGWQKSLGERLKPYLPGRTIEVVNRGIPGAASDQGLHNVKRVIDDDPTVVIIEFAINDALAVKGITVEAAMANTLSIMNQIRLAVRNVKIVLMTTSNVRNPEAGIIGEHRYYDMYRYVGLRDDGPAADWLFDGASFWWQVADQHFPDGVHPTVFAWREYLVPRLERFLGPKLRDLVISGKAHLPLTTRPSEAWTPLP